MSWDQLQAISDEARQTAEAERNTPPVACPNDYTRLDDVDGILHCQFCGWTSSPLPRT